MLIRFVTYTTHIEEKNQIGTDSFVQVFRRIITTSKNVRVIHSHNGSNFVGSKT